MSQPAHLPRPNQSGWQLEQFRLVYQLGSLAVGLGLVIYVLAFAFLRYWQTLVIGGLLAVAISGFYICWQIARRGNPERGIEAFVYAIVGLMVSSFYFQSDVIGFNIMVLFVPIVLANYLLPARRTQRVVVIGSLAIIHNLVIASLNPFHPPTFPALATVLLNVVVGPSVLVVIAIVNYRSSRRTEQAITQLEQQSAGLEEIVSRRTSQLAVAAEIGRAASSVLDLSELLHRTVELIRDRFGYYHASIFLLDETGSQAVVRESTGEIGRQLKERKHTLAVGSQSIIGYVTSRRAPRIALDVDADAVHFKNPLLPETRSEMAIPLIVGERLLGALDVQSREPNAFTSADVAVLQTLADQLAVAINNAELFAAQQQLLVQNQQLLEDSQKTLAELNALTGRLSQEGWREFLESQSGTIVAETGRVPSANADSALAQALEKGRLIQTGGEHATLAAPILLRGQPIGALALEEIGADHEWTEDDLALAQEVAEHLGLALDNARLLEQLNKERERLVFLFESSQALAANLSLNNIIATALKFASSIGAEHAYVLYTGEGQAIFRSTIPDLDRFTGVETQAVVKAAAARGLDRWVFENRQPVLVKDALLDDRWLPRISQEQVRSILAAPLRSQRTNEVVGVLAYTHTLPSAFADDQLPLLDSISTQISVALQNAILYQNLGRQQYGATALAKATQAMARTLSEEDLMQALTEELFNAYKPNGVTVLHWEAATETFTPITLKLNPNEADAWPALRQSFPASDRPDLMEVIRRRALWMQRLREEPEDKVRETMSLPFIFDEQVEAVVEVVHTGPSAGLSPDDVELFRSITTSAAYSLQTVRLYQQLRETADRLREVDRLKSQFLANMSHELRTPLNSIIGFSRVIIKGIDGPITDLQRQDLSAIHTSGQHLLNLINDILDLAKVEAGKMDLSFDKVDLPEIVRSVLTTISGLVRERPIRLIPEIQPDLPPVYADSFRVRQVLINLLSNAAKFTEQGSITIKAFVIDASAPRPMVQVTVRDTGIGISEADISKLFQSFSQVDGSATRKTGGTGLGLAITRNLVEMHGGAIWVESQLGAETAFNFTLPVYTEMIDAPEPAPGDSRQSILAIDDDARLIDLYRRYLEPKGFLVHGLTNSQEALAAAKAFKPRAILLDVLMRDRDGWQVLQELKDDPDTQQIPVFICSVLAEHEKALSLGAAGYLVKPILDVDLFSALSRLNGVSAHHPKPAVVADNS
ncbi:MAG: GAF domain-containing protein [Chloroflexi bacterium]|nr:GAF domain-containing protein [Chloroflexota bacterium]